MNELLDDYYLLSDPDLFPVTEELQATLNAIDDAIYLLRIEEEEKHG